MLRRILGILAVGLIFTQAQAADTVPTDIMQPGTQPQEVTNLESPDKCDNCHGGYNSSVEPAHTWRGSMMAHAGRDPIFWATVAIAEQDFDGAGDLCIRCHSTAGWLAGRSTPTDGSGLAAGDSDGVECDFCHKLTNPDDSEHIGVQSPPFLANDFGDPGADPNNMIGYYGSGMASVSGGNEKHGPYIDAGAKHQFTQSQFTRSVDFCGTCHDVSNAAVGNLAHNSGAQATADPVIANGVLGGPVDGKAAFNNPPYKYGVVERTFSEYKSALVSKTLVSEYPNLPADLQAGALKAGYESAIVAGTGGNYADGTPRYFSCQTCHMRPVTGKGANKRGIPVRTDLPLHDMTGGNYWMPSAIQHLDSLGKLRLGGGMSAAVVAGLTDGIARAQKQLSEAATLTVTGGASPTVKVINHTGHKVISGYPEGRRMWLNIEWYDVDGQLIREDGAYGPLVDAAGNPVTVINPADGQAVQVESILDLHDPNTRIYEAHMGMTQEWAAQLLSLGYSPDLALLYNRETGDPDFTLGQLGAVAPGTSHETFHFVLNNTVVGDNRIPPYGMDCEEARKRNALPVPSDQYGGVALNPGDTCAGVTYNYWDDVTLNNPANATYASIKLLYQPTSWEYIQFLVLGNNGQNVFLANEGVNMLDAWLNAGSTDIHMAKPYVMAVAEWGQTTTPPDLSIAANSTTTWSVSRQGAFVAQADSFTPRDSVGIRSVVIEDHGGLPLSGAQVFIEIRDGAGALVISLQGFSDSAGVADTQWKTGRNTAAGSYTATVVDIIKNGYVFDPALGDTTAVFTVQ